MKLLHIQHIAIKYNKQHYLEYLENNKIDTRPIVTGNFARQPVFKDLSTVL